MNIQKYFSQLLSVFPCARAQTLGGLVLGPQGLLRGLAGGKDRLVSGRPGKARTAVLGRQEQQYVLTGHSVSSKALSSVTHDHHCTGHVACLPSFNFPRRLPVLHFQGIQSKLSHYHCPQDKPRCLSPRPHPKKHISQVDGKGDLNVP